MLSHTECTVNVARHARSIQHANQVGWLIAAQPTSAATAAPRATGWLARASQRLLPTRRPRAEVAA